MSHASAGLDASAASFHLVVDPERAIKKQKARAAQAIYERRGHRCATRDEEKAGSARSQDFEAYRILGFPADFDVVPFHVKRHFPRHGKGPDSKSRSQVDVLVECECAAFNVGRVESVEDGVGGENVQNRLRGEQFEGLAFAEGQEAGDVVDVAIGKHDRADGAVARADLGMKFRGRQNLVADLRGGVQERPMLAVIADRERALVAPVRCRIPGPGALPYGT